MGHVASYVEIVGKYSTYLVLIPIYKIKTSTKTVIVLLLITSIC